MDDAIIEVLEQYHARMERENLSFPVAAPGGRNSVNFQSMLAIGPETGQFLNILVHSLTAPRILELGTSFGYSAIWLAEAATQNFKPAAPSDIGDFRFCAFQAISIAS